MSLRQKTIKATSVILLGHSGAQLIRFAGNLITTRLLAPELFGVMAIANALVTVVLLLSDLGITMSIIRSERGEEPRYLKTVFSLKVIQGLILSLLIGLLGVFIWGLSQWQILPVESALNHEDLPIAIAIVAFSALINGFQSIEIDLQKRFQRFTKQTVLALIAQITALAFIISTGYLNPSIYSLAFANVVSAATLTLGSYMVFERKHFGFAWDLSAIKEIFHFGKWITASSAIVGVSNNLDRFLFGYFFTGTQMGLYAIATLIFAAMDGIFKKMNTTLFPAISEVLRDTPERISQVYYKIRIYRDVITCAPACLIIVNGDLLVKALYDDRYHAAGHFLQLMSIAHLIEAFMFKNQVITAMGNSKIQFQTAIWRLFGLLLLIPTGNYFLGVDGIVLSIALRRLFGSWLLFSIFSDLKILRWKKELRTLGLILVFFLISYLIRHLILWILNWNFV